MGAPTRVRAGGVVVELERIVHDPAVMGGKACVRGTRVTVSTVLGLLAQGHSEDAVLELYPYLTREDVRAALSYAAMRTSEIEVPLTDPLPQTGFVCMSIGAWRSFRRAGRWCCRRVAGPGGVLLPAGAGRANGAQCH